jgi:hypothetical protein
MWTAASAISVAQIGTRVFGTINQTQEDQEISFDLPTRFGEEAKP